MRQVRMRVRRTFAALTLIGVALVLVVPASAEPPPPDFIEFTITNGTSLDAKDVKVEIYQAVPPFYRDLPPTPTNSITFPTIGAGKTKPWALSPMFGVAKIVCSGKFGSVAFPTVEIVAEKGEFDDEAGNQEYAGFTPKHPGGVMLPLGLDLLPPKKAGDPNRIRLHAYDGWDGKYWGQKQVEQDIP